MPSLGRRTFQEETMIENLGEKRDTHEQGIIRKGKRIHPYIISNEGLTHEMKEEVIGDKARCVGSSMAIVDTDEGGISPGLHLAVVLEDLVGLDDREGEIPGRVLPDVPRPQQRIVVLLLLILPHTRDPLGATPPLEITSAAPASPRSPPPRATPDPKSNTLSALNLASRRRTGTATYPRDYLHVHRKNPRGPQGIGDGEAVRGVSKGGKGWEWTYGSDGDRRPRGEASRPDRNGGRRMPGALGPFNARGGHNGSDVKTDKVMSRSEG
ncbi:hypothetical protein BHE74_00026421 [Ensete ventricosum]|nr:hypothetical protein GW17_00022238 [Ensete ventricosum]RWW66252.1 hypothetical protein BHE74_00026421 [Ensete ventricosum]